MSITLDADVLPYATDRSSPVHDVAQAELRRYARGPEPLYLSWPVTMAYLRIATHPVNLRPSARLRRGGGQRRRAPGPWPLRP